MLLNPFRRRHFICALNNKVSEFAQLVREKDSGFFTLFSVTSARKDAFMYSNIL